MAPLSFLISVEKLDNSRFRVSLSNNKLKNFVFGKDPETSEIKFAQISCFEITLRIAF